MNLNDVMKLRNLLCFGDFSLDADSVFSSLFEYDLNLKKLKFKEIMKKISEKTLTFG